MVFVKTKRQVVLMCAAGIVIVLLIAFGLAARHRMNDLSDQNMLSVREDNVLPAAVPIVVTEPLQIKKHVVSQGETLSTIARQYNIDVDTLLSANPNVNERLDVGQELAVLPAKGVLYVVNKGDTLSCIASTYGVDARIIQEVNKKRDDNLVIGEKIFLPGAKTLTSVDPAVARSQNPVSRGNNNRIVWPTTGEISSPFGYRWGRLHAGVDIANDMGTPIRAAMAGRVTYAAWCDGYGNMVMIKHNQGYETLYGHLLQYIVEKGQVVQSGQVIAYMGSTGNSTGPHLHFEVHIDGQLVNPISVLP
jgi:murein DD-endopeptidase MepM/ murein hydrolase activator NlpD